MNFIKKYRAINKGIRMAEANIERIQRHEAEHAQRHEDIENYDCGPAAHRLQHELSETVAPFRGDPWFGGGYIGRMNLYSKERAEAVDPIAQFREMFPDGTIIPFMVGEDESEESIDARIRQAIEDTEKLAAFEREQEGSTDDKS